MSKQKPIVWPVRVFLANQTRPDQPTYMFIDVVANAEGLMKLAETVNVGIQSTEYFRRNTVDYAIAYVPDPLNITEAIGLLLRARASYRKVPRHVADDVLAKIVGEISDRLFLQQAHATFEVEAKRRKGMNTK